MTYEEIKAEWIVPAINTGAEWLKECGHTALPVGKEKSSMTQYLRFVPDGGASGENVRGVPKIDDLPYIQFKAQPPSIIVIAYRDRAGRGWLQHYEMDELTQHDVNGAMEAFLSGR